MPKAKPLKNDIKVNNDTQSSKESACITRDLNVIMHMDLKG
jgi:hypothetical protein